MPDAPLPRYSLWQAIGVALSLATRAVEEVRAGGKPGPQGEPGERGEDGRTPAFRGLWKVASAYEASDVVMVQGSSFVALCDVPGACPGDDWRLVASCGKSGQRGAAGERGERGWPGPPGAAPVALEVDDQGLLTLRLSDGSALTCDFYPVLSRIVR
jgi:hypothetical protein